MMLFRLEMIAEELSCMSPMRLTEALLEEPPLGMGDFNEVSVKYLEELAPRMLIRSCCGRKVLRRRLPEGVTTSESVMCEHVEL